MTNNTIALAPSSEQRSEAIDFKQNIHYLRGIAALAVMLFHSGHYFSVYYGADVFRSVFPDVYGIYGVAIFFAISGYLMAELAVRQPPFEFLVRRILRIYPAMIIAVTVVLSLASAAYLSNYRFESLSLAPIGRTTYALGVEWTLVNEMFFYVVLFVLSCAGLKRFVVPAAILWLLAICGNAILASSFPAIGKANILEIPLMVANFGFAAGLLIPVFVKRGNFSLLFVCVFLVSVIVSLLVPPSFVRIFAGMGSACLVAASIKTSISLPRYLEQFLSSMGSWSYALYLVHVPIFMAMFRYKPDNISIYAIYCTAVVVTLLAAAVLGKIDIALAQRTKLLVRPSNTLYVKLAGFIFISAYVALCLIYVL